MPSYFECLRNKVLIISIHLLLLSESTVELVRASIASRPVIEFGFRFLDICIEGDLSS